MSAPAGAVLDVLVGQEPAVAQLMAAIDAAADGSGGFTHAWLFTGPPGSGRSVAARAFAAALQCPWRGCGACPACHTALAGTSADVAVTSPAGLSIGVDEARDIVRRAALAPAGGRWHVVIVEDADRLTEAAANALLKVIEEPPRQAVFLLCVPAPDDLPPTIRSRCRLVRLRTPSVDAVARELVARDGVDPAMAAFAARAAQGHVGRARRLATDDDARRQRRDVLAVPVSVGSVAACFAAAEALVSASEEESSRITAPLAAAETTALKEALGEGGTGKVKVRGSTGALKDLERRHKSRETRHQRDMLDRALTDLAAFYRDVLLVQTGSDVPLVNADVRDQVERVARAGPPERTLRRMEAILACRERIAANVAPLLAVEEMALALHG
ncbi:MAG: DNA polymerase III subunit delta' [Frankiaceae bacterium]